MLQDANLGDVMLRKINTNTKTLAPVLPEERIVVLDVLRGFALFGILVMNMWWFTQPASAWALDPRLFQGWVDRTADFLTGAIFAGKANSIFSFLFGLGMTIQLERAAARGGKLVPLYLRRLLVLFLIGATHSILLWHGDVLHIYAVLGLLLLALRRASDRTIFVLIGVFLVAPIVRSGWALYHSELPPHSIPYYRQLAHEHIRVFQQGSYAEQVAVRIHDINAMYIEAGQRLQGAIWTYPSFSVTMLLGFYAGRERLFSDVPANAAKFRRVMWGCLGLGVALAVGFAVLHALRPPPTGRPTVLGFFAGALFNLNRPLLCIGYIAAITLLLQRERVKRALMPLARAGAMPLTNYLMQSVMATAIFYSYGLGLFAKVGPALAFAISMAIFAVQVVYSRLWLSHFRFGPLEWLWRGATYGKFPPLRMGKEGARAGGTS